MASINRKIKKEIDFSYLSDQFGKYSTALNLIHNLKRCLLQLESITYIQ